MNRPPPWKKCRIEYTKSITGSSREKGSLRTGALGSRRLRADRVVVELAQEHVAVDGLAPVVERARHRERVAELGALPRHDHERLRRIVVAEDRHALHLLVAVRSGGGSALNFALLRVAARA